MTFLANLFGGGPKPLIPSPAPPDIGSAASQDAADAIRKRAAMPEGRESTLLTTGNDQPAASRQRTLLGA